MNQVIVIWDCPVLINNINNNTYLTPMLHCWKKNTYVVYEKSGDENIGAHFGTFSGTQNS